MSKQQAVMELFERFRSRKGTGKPKPRGKGATSGTNARGKTGGRSSGRSA